ncbi:acetyl-CoA carboxylase biotin carboxyl carrier protein [Microbacterium sediminicola]|uniref:Biotin carboxyl carrier protein of acetyl-CoA carboxylase n=1 Tax=Microbacterium sediminicola TaxID=415210 RepID=A0ABN2IIL1_9MICO
MSHNSPDLAELRAIIDWVNMTDDVRELSITFGDVDLFISRDRQSTGSKAAVAAAPTPVAPAPAAPTVAAPPATATPAGAELGPKEVLVKAPMVGMFYASPKPGAPTFVSVGDQVEVGSVLCIVEVMKLMNNVEASVAGTVSRILVDNEQAVEYGQPLMVITRND